MKQRNGLFRAVLSALLFILVSVPASAQDFRGSINGTVSDDTGEHKGKRLSTVAHFDRTNRSPPTR